MKGKGEGSDVAKERSERDKLVKRIGKKEKKKDTGKSIPTICGYRAQTT